MSPAPAPQLLLDAWHRARRQRPSRRAATMLSVLTGEPDAAALPIGVRDRRLFALLQAVDSRQLTGVANCPSCGTAIEITTDAATWLSGGAMPGPIAVSLEGETILVRLPDTSDVERAAGTPDPARALAERCLVAPRDLTRDDVDRITDAIFAADPLLDPEIGVTCPACAQETIFLIDVATYLWNRIDARARQLMRQVHVLARAYGWSEAEVLALPEWRRAAYLTMVEA